MFLSQALIENRHGLLMDFTVSQATSTAKRRVVPELLDGVRERGYRPRTLRADCGYDTKDCIKTIRSQRVTPHVAQKKHSVIDGRTTRHTGYAVNLRIHKRVEEVFGWMKTVGDLRRTRYRGRDRTGLTGYLVRRANLPLAPEAEPVLSGYPPRILRVQKGYHRACGAHQARAWEAAPESSKLISPLQHRFRRPRRSR